MPKPFNQNFNTLPFIVEIVDQSLQNQDVKTKSEAIKLIQNARLGLKKHDTMSDCQNISADLAEEMQARVIIVGDDISKHALVIKDQMTIYDPIFGNFEGVSKNQTSIQGVNEFRYENGVFLIKRSTSRSGTFIEQSYQIPKVQDTVELEPFELTMANFAKTPYLATIWRYMANSHLGGSLNLLEQQSKDTGKIVIKCEVPSQKSFETYSYTSNTKDFDSSSVNYKETLHQLSQQISLDKSLTKEQLEFVSRNYSHISKLKTLLNS